MRKSINYFRITGAPTEIRIEYHLDVGLAVAQAVSRWLPTAAEHVGFVLDKAALGQVFSEYFGFPCQSFHQFLHNRNHPGLAQ
jgi:hypothetical protein